jgi:TPR repeat protein
MADVARDASGPSPKPRDVAPQQASRPDSPDRGKLRVFISYSRDDLYFANQLDAALKAYGFECFIDREGISGGEEWKQRLGNLIRDADTVVFVLSPTSARSEICAWEVGEAARLGKRIVPVNCRPLEGAIPPPRLRDLNYIFFYADPKVLDSGFGTGLLSLVEALNTDFDWLREHTRYLQRATEWDSRGRPPNRLLSGDDIAEAKAWVARRPKNAPEPTALHLDFIRASEEEAEARLSAQRKQLEAMAAAQAERETALHDREEALKQRARVARVRNIALVAVSILALIAVVTSALSLWSYGRAKQDQIVAEQQKQTAEQQRTIAEQQRIAAEEQRQQANELLARGTTIIGKIWYEMDFETRKDAFALLQAGAKQGDTLSMVDLALMYQDGRGVERDYVKAREWWEKAAAKDWTTAMTGLGQLYQSGLGVEKDYVKARELYEKAAARGDARAMTRLGQLYAKGDGVPKDYAKAREWLEKASDKGEAQGIVTLAWLYQSGLGVEKDDAKAHELHEKAAARGDPYAQAQLDKPQISEAAEAGRYAEALQLQEVSAAKMETMETKGDYGAPGWNTATALNLVTRYALFAQEFAKALTAADHAHALLPHDLIIETNRAHALMFMERGDEAKALYLAHKGQPISEEDNQLWERAIAEDFEKFRKAGLTHRMMADIERELGVSPDDR